MKFLFILLIFISVSGLLALRFRRQILMAKEMWRMFGKMQQKDRSKEEKQFESKEPRTAGKLVKCSKCGTWTPLNRAIYFRSKTFYCSTKCLESMAPN